MCLLPASVYPTNASSPMALMGPSPFIGLTYATATNPPPPPQLPTTQEHATAQIQCLPFQQPFTLDPERLGRHSGGGKAHWHKDWGSAGLDGQWGAGVRGNIRVEHMLLLLLVEVLTTQAVSRIHQVNAVFGTAEAYIGLQIHSKPWWKTTSNSKQCFMTSFLQLLP